MDNPTSTGLQIPEVRSFGRSAYGWPYKNLPNRWIAEVPTLGLKDDVFNITSFTKPDPEDVAKQIWRGTTASTARGRFGRKCEREGGTISGYGPGCHTWQETGELEASLCYAEKIADAVQQWGDRVSAAFESVAQIMTVTGARAFQITSGYSELDAAYPADSNPPGFAKMFDNDPPIAWAYVDTITRHRERIAEAVQNFNNEVRNIEDACACRRCIYKFGPTTIPNKPPQSDTSNPTDPAPVQDEIVPEFDELETSSNFDTIPRVFGRYIVGGNVTWIGNSVTTQFPAQIEDAENGVRTVTMNETSCDFMLGLCHGEVSQLLRLFFDDVLVVNNTLDPDNLGAAASNLDLSALVDNPLDLTLLNYRKPKITLYKGTASQKVLKEQAIKEGFGKVPAYRDLAYLYLDNVNLNVLGGNFPKVQADVSTAVQEDALVVESEELVDVYPSFISTDLRTGRQLTYNLDGYTVTDYDTMDVVETDGVALAGEYMFTDIGHVMHYEYLAPNTVSVFDPTLPDVDAIPPLETNILPRMNAYGAMMYKFVRCFDSVSKRAFDILVYTSASNQLAHVLYDYSNRTLFATTPVTGLFSYATAPVSANAIASVNGQTCYYQFGISAAGMHAARYHVRDENSAFIAAPSAAQKTYEIIPGTTLWGADTTGVEIANVLEDASDNTFIFFFKCTTSGTFRITKLRAATLQLVWSVPYAAGFDNWAQSEAGLARAATGYMYFIDAAGDVQRIELQTGIIEHTGEVDDYTPGAAQFYDGRTRSLTYMSDDNTLKRIFLERFSSERVSLATVVDSLAARTAVTKFLIDTSGIQDVTFQGYAISDNTTMLSVLQEFQDFYQIVMVKDGAQLKLVTKEQIATPIEIDRDSIIGDSLRTSELTDNTLPDTIQVTFVNLTDTGIEPNIQTVSLKGDDEATNENVIQEKLTVYDTPAAMRRYAEQALRYLRRNRSIVTVQLMPHSLGLTPQDAIQIDDKIYRIGQLTIGPENNADVEGTKVLLEEETEQVNLDGVVNSSIRAQGNFRSSNYHPVVLFTNAITSEDGERAAGIAQVAYALIEAREMEITPTQVSTRIFEHYAYDYTSAAQPFPLDSPRTIEESPTFTSDFVTRAAHAATLITPPSGVRHNPFTFKEDDTLVVEFVHEESVDLLVNIAEPYVDVLETPDGNLLVVGREYIKFATFEVDPMNPRRVTFSNIFRGWGGTEPYMDHEAGERCYLYTADTFIAFEVDEYYTKRNALASVFLAGPTPAGTQYVQYIQQSDAGSARPWAPTDIDLYALTENSKFDVRLRWYRRNPFFFNQLENLGALQNPWNSNAYFVWMGPEDYTLEDFEGHMRGEVPTAQVRVNDVENGISGTVIGTFYPETTARMLTLCHLSTDSRGEYVMGHPAFRRAPYQLYDYVA